PAADRHGGVPPAARRVPPGCARGGAQGMTARRQPRGEAVPWAMYERLPGGALVEAGLRDLRAGQETAPALVVALLATRLRREGRRPPPTPLDPEHRLYRLLARNDPDSAHGRYNALVRRMVSFIRALPCAT